MAELQLRWPDPLDGHDDAESASARLASSPATASNGFASLLASVAGRDSQLTARPATLPASPRSNASSPDDEWAEVVTPGPEEVSELAFSPPTSPESRRAFTTTDHRTSQPPTQPVFASTIEARLLDSELLEPGRVEAIDHWRQKAHRAVTPSLPEGGSLLPPRSIAPTSVVDAEDVSVVSLADSSDEADTHLTSLSRSPRPPRPTSPSPPSRPALFAALAPFVTPLRKLVQSSPHVAGFLLALVTLVVPLGDVIVPTPAPVPAHEVEPVPIRTIDAPPSSVPVPTLPMTGVEPLRLSWLLMSGVAIGVAALAWRVRARQRTRRRAAPPRIRASRSPTPAPSTSVRSSPRLLRFEQRRETVVTPAPFELSVCVLGAHGVGCSRLVVRQTDKDGSAADDDARFTSQLAVPARAQNFTRGGVSVTLNVCDWGSDATSRQRTNKIDVAVVYSAVDGATLDHAIQLIGTLRRGPKLAPDASVWLVANKTDLVASRTRSAVERGRTWAEANAVEFAPVSARTGEGVQAIFRGIARAARS